MRRISYALPVFCFFFFSLFISGCKDKVEVVEPVDSDDIITSVNNATTTDTVAYGAAAGAPTVWSSFESIFKTCVKNSTLKDKSLFSKYRLLYLGPSNPRYLGAVYSKNGVEGQTELTKWVTPEQMKQFVSFGLDVPGCDVSTIRDNFLSISLGNLAFTDSTLKLVLANKDSMVNTVGTWSIDEINNADFVKFLNDNKSDQNISYYRDVMTGKNNVVAFKVVKVSGFETDIKLNKQINADINLSLPILKTLTKAGKDSVLCSLKLNRTADKTVHLKTDGSFYAFALVMKGKKI